jgi:hypothetical protein
MSLTTVKEILAPLSSASEAMSDALQQAQDDLSGGVSDARASIAGGAKRSLKSAKISGDRARRAWYERADLIRDRSQDAQDQAATSYRNALAALSGTWSRAAKALRNAGDQAGELEVKIRTDAAKYSQRGAGWARQNPHIVGAVVAVAGYLIIRGYRKRKQRRLKALADEATRDVGDAANDEAVHTQRLA